MAQCPGEAVDIAWKLLRHVYRDLDGAIRALRRTCRGLSTDEARNVLDLARLVIEEAIRIVKPVNRAVLEQYRARQPNGPDSETRAQFEQTLTAQFPGCTPDAARRAIQNAVIYHIL